MNRPTSSYRLGSLFSLLLAVGARATEPPQCAPCTPTTPLTTIDFPAEAAPNEAACTCEKVSSGFSLLEFNPAFPPVRFISHQHICDGNKCYIVEDAAAHGTDEAQPLALESGNSDPIVESKAAPPFGDLLNSPLKRSLESRAAVPSIPVPPAEISYLHSDTLSDLRVANAELTAKLEMTMTILDLQKEYTQQILELERANAQMGIELAELRVRHEMSEQLTASLVERTELLARLHAAHEWISNRTVQEVDAANSALVEHPGSACEEALATIHEDLSNIRRQLPLLRQTPIPFAVSQTIPSEKGYTPLLQPPLEPSSVAPPQDRSASLAEPNRVRVGSENDSEETRAKR